MSLWIIFCMNSVFSRWDSKLLLVFRLICVWWYRFEIRVNVWVLLFFWFLFCFFLFLFVFFGFCFVVDWDTGTLAHSLVLRFVGGVYDYRHAEKPNENCSVLGKLSDVPSPHSAFACLRVFVTVTAATAATAFVDVCMCACVSVCCCCFCCFCCRTGSIDVCRMRCAVVCMHLLLLLDHTLTHRWMANVCEWMRMCVLAEYGTDSGSGKRTSGRRDVGTSELVRPFIGFSTAAAIPIALRCFWLRYMNCVLVECVSVSLPFCLFAIWMYRTKCGCHRCRCRALLIALHSNWFGFSE